MQLQHETLKAQIKNVCDEDAREQILDPWTIRLKVNAIPAELNEKSFYSHFD